MNEKRWTNEVERVERSKENIEVLCNEQAFSWLSGTNLSPQEYDTKFLNTTAHIQLKRIREAELPLTT